MVLRDYQSDIKNRIVEAWKQGFRSVMCQLPTGTGKTVVMREIVFAFLGENNENENQNENCHADGNENEKGNRGVKVLVVAHRREILQQIVSAITETRNLGNSGVMVESIQKLSRMKDLGERMSPELVIIDEAHHATAKTYRMLWEAFPEAKFLGLTATPYRLKQEGFTDLFDRLICGWQVSRFIDEGWLSLFEFVTVKPDGDMMKRVLSLQKRGVDGDYQMKEMGSVMDNRASIEQLYESYVQYAEGRKGIIYAINREHGQHITEYYRDHGVDVVMIDAMTPAEQRKQWVEDYQKDKIRVLVSVDCFGEGFDCPMVSFIQLARPTLSLSKYLQQVGRGLRPHEDKKKTIILDNVGGYYLFGLPNEDRDWERMWNKSSRTDYGRVVALKMQLNAENRMIDTLEGHDNEMVVVMSDGELERKTRARYVKGELRTDKNGWMSFWKGDRRMTDDAFTDMVMRVDDYMVLRHWNGDMMIYTADGGHVWTKPAEYDIRMLMEDGFAEIYDKEKDLVLYLDLKTMNVFTDKPQVVNVDFVSFIKMTDGYALRTRKWYDARYDEGDLTVKGDVFQHRDSKTGIQTFLHRSKPDVLFKVVGYDDDHSKILIHMDYKSNQLPYYFWYKNGQLTLIGKGWK